MLVSIPNLSRFYNQYENAEYEIRFGEYHGRRFINGIEKSTFFKIVDFLSSNTDFNEVYPEVVERTKEKQEDNHQYYSLIFSLPNDPGKIRIDYHNDNEPFVTYKKNIENIDFQNMYMRLSINEEKDMTGQSENLSLTLEKHYKKYRWTYVASPNGKLYSLFKDCRIDLTIVEDLKEENIRFKKQYQLEIEFPSYTTQQKIHEMMYYFLILIQQSEIIIPQHQKQHIITKFNSLFYQREKPRHQLLNPLIKPVNFKMRVFNEMNKYAITDKADGVRQMVFIAEDGIYLLFPNKFVSKYSNNTIPQLVNTVYDAEIIDNYQNQRVILLFDILIYKNRDVRNASFSDRWTEYVLRSNQQNNLLKFNIHLKHYLFPKDGTIFDRAGSILLNVKEKGIPNDGLIYNHLDDRYDRNAIIYKWKPIHLLTIDFMVVEDADAERKTFKLYIRTKDGLVHYKNLVFQPTSEDISLINNSIVEFTYSNERKSFIPLRIRNDKIDPNFIHVADDVYNDIMNPITEDTIIGKNFNVMRKWHNKIKLDLIENQSQLRPNGYVLDIGGGRGGDILKYVKAKQNVFFVEPNDDHIREMKSRLETSFGYTLNVEQFSNSEFDFYYNDTNGLFVCILKAYGQEYQKIRSMIQRVIQHRKLSAICMFNSLTFFFENINEYLLLLNNFALHMDENTIFVGMVMDGLKTKQLLIPFYSLRRELAKVSSNEVYDLDMKQIVSKDAVEGKYKSSTIPIVSNNREQLHRLEIDMYENQGIKVINNDMMEMKFVSNITDEPFGNKLYIDLKDTIVDKQYEYLVDFDWMAQDLEYRFGLKVSNQYFTLNDQLSQGQKLLNNLYKAFIFRPSSSTREKLEKYSTKEQKLIQDIEQQQTIPLPLQDLKQKEEEKSEEELSIRPETRTLIKDNIYAISVIPDEHIIFHLFARSLLDNYILQTNNTDHVMLTRDLIEYRMIYGNKLSNLYEMNNEDTPTLQQVSSMFGTNVVVLNEELQPMNKDMKLDNQKDYEDTIFLLKRNDQSIYEIVSERLGDNEYNTKNILPHINPFKEIRRRENSLKEVRRNLFKETNIQETQVEEEIPFKEINRKPIQEEVEEEKSAPIERKEGYMQVKDNADGYILYRIIEKDNMKKLDIQILKSNITTDYNLGDYIQVDWSSFDKVRIGIKLLSINNQNYIIIPEGVKHLIINGVFMYKLEMMGLPTTLEELTLKNVELYYGQGFQTFPNLQHLSIKNKISNTNWNNAAPYLLTLNLETGKIIADTIHKLENLEKIVVRVPNMTERGTMKNLKSLQRLNKTVKMELYCDQDIVEKVATLFLMSSISSIVNPERITINGKSLTTFHYEQPKDEASKRSVVLSQRPIIQNRRPVIRIRDKKPKRKGPSIQKLLKGNKKRYE